MPGAAHIPAASRSRHSGQHAYGDDKLGLMPSLAYTWILSAEC